MKSKNFKKKLTLNKKTVVNLGKQTMVKVYGGRPTIYVESACICDREEPPTGIITCFC
jgi:hypothetical protein